VHEAGVSVRGRVQGTESEIADEDLEDHIVQWPALLPSGRGSRSDRKPDVSRQSLSVLIESERGSGLLF